MTEPTETPTPTDPAAVAPSDEATAGEASPAAGESSETREQLAERNKVLSAQLEDSTTRARETQQRLKEEHERLLRMAAEFENFKKRASKEKDDVRKYGVESLLKEFLPVADNLDRALDHAEQHDPKQVIEGVKLVQKMLESALAKHGVVGFSALGQMFDPAQHEALMQAESELPPGTVVQEMARGYKLAERLVRPAAVVVARPREARASAAEAAPAPGAEEPKLN